MSNHPTPSPTPEERDSDSFCVLRPLLDVGPVPAGTPAHGPLRVGQKSAMTPHRDRVLLHSQPSCDVVRADRITCHASIIKCNGRVDKCNGSGYSRYMAQSTQSEAPKEAAMFHTIVTTEAFEASQPGALSGHAAVCSCGERIRTSLSASEALHQGGKHADYMNTKEGR